MIIQLPYTPVGYCNKLFVDPKKEIHGVKEALKNAADRGFQVGVQLMMGETTNDHYDFFLGNYEKILNIVKKELGPLWDHSSFHLPIANKRSDRQMNMDFPESLDFHRSLLIIAKRVGIRSVTLHTNTVYLMNHPEARNVPQEEYMDFNWTSDKKAGVARQNALTLAREFPDIKFSYENMPVPINGDLTTDPDQIRVERHLVTPAHWDSFFEGMPENVGLCLDTAHYIIARETLHYFRSRPELLENRSLRVLIGSLNPTITETEPSLEQCISFLESVDMPKLESLLIRYENRIFDIQAQDTHGTWIPKSDSFGGQLIVEGLPLIMGTGFYTELLALLAKTKDSEIALSIDVQEKDYAKRDRQVRSMVMLDSMKKL